MQHFSGVGVSPGRVIGLVRQMPPSVTEPPAGEVRPGSTTEDDAVAALRAASVSVQAELQRRAAAAPAGNARAVLEATALMAVDPMLIKSAVKLIKGGATAERAAWDAGASVAEMLHNLGGYMADRATDVLDVRARLVARGFAAADRHTWNETAAAHLPIYRHLREAAYA